MKLKIIVTLFFFFVVLIFSYSSINKDEINYTILGDKELFSNNIISKNFSDLIYEKIENNKNFGFYNEDFIKDNIRIIDVINQIKNNEVIDNKTIQSTLKETDLLILSIGNNEINYKLSKVNINESNDKIIYSYLDEVEIDFEKLIDEINRYCDKNIIILGYYNDTNNIINDKYYKYINNKIKRLCKNNIIYIDLFDILNKNNKYLTKTTPVYITNEGNLALFNVIYSKINKFYLHKRY